ncbi:MAG: DUF1416 domain-containing protein [Planctomycetes bacterium]|nr:DUF1416 domain-containing protein [Planctomycetota bacterium]
MRAAAGCAVLGLVAMLGTELRAQRVVGVVLGFDGEPVANAFVRVFDDRGEAASQLLTDAHGRFEIDSDTPRSVVEVALEAVIVERPVPAEASQLRIDFASERHFLVRGHLVDPGGHLRPSVEVRLLGEGRRGLAEATTDDKGAFAVHANVAVTAIVVDPAGWNVEFSQQIERDADLVLDLAVAHHRLFRLTGRVLDDAARPVAGATVATQAPSRATQRGRTAADGTFELWCSGEVTALHVHRDFAAFAVVEGHWRAEGAIDVRQAEHGFALVAGRAVDRDGHPFAGVEILALADRGAPAESGLRVATSKADGSFYARVRLQRPWLCARPRNGRPSPPVAWEPGAVVELAVPEARRRRR